MRSKEFFLFSQMASSTSSPYPYPATLNVGNFVSLRLLPNNYLLWRTQMLALIESQDMYGLVNGEYEMPTPTIVSPVDKDIGVSKESQNPNFVGWRRSDRLLRG